MQDYLLHLIKWVAALLLAVCMSIPAAIVALGGFILIDFMTGLLSAFVRKEVDSSVGVRGGVKKCLLLGLVLSLDWAQKSVGLDIHIEKLMSGYFIILELISIVENCARAGIAVPAIAVEALIKVRMLYPRTMTAEEVEAAFKRAEQRKTEQSLDH